MKANANVLQQQSRRTANIPTQPLMRTIGKGDMPRVQFVPAEIISINTKCLTTPPTGWNGTRWHDGAD
jgi:hypothetical protein